MNRIDEVKSSTVVKGWRYAPLPQPYSNRVCTQMRWRKSSALTRTLKVPPRALGQRWVKSLTDFLTSRRHVHATYEWIHPHLQSPSWLQTSGTHRWGNRWNSTPPGCTEHRSAVFLLPSELLQSHPVNTKQRFVQITFTTVFVWNIHYSQHVSHRNSISNMHDTKYIHDVTNPL